MRTTTRVIAAAAAVLALAGCTPNGGSMSTTPSPGGSGLPVHTMPALPTGQQSVEPTQAQLAAIRSDLLGRGVTGEVSVVSSVQVTWNDGSLGCPQPGISYTQSLISGAKVVVKVDGKSYDYRFGDGPHPVLCKKSK